MTQIRVVGAGLSGLMAAILAAERGAEVTLLARGRGSLELSHGCIDIWRAGDLAAQIESLDSDHPYRLMGEGAVAGGLHAFMRLMQSESLSYLGDYHQAMLLPTALGVPRPTNFAPRSQMAGDMEEEEPLTLGRIEGFRDFFPEMAADNLRKAGVAVSGIVDLPLPGLPERDYYASDLGRSLDLEEDGGGLLQIWAHRLERAGVRRLALPAVLGMRHAEEVHRRFEAFLGMPVFEIPTLPPSLPGLRLERALWRAADAVGVHIVEGPTVCGLPDEIETRGRVSALTARTAGAERIYPADFVFLGTGGILNGGIRALQDGALTEAVLDLPIHADPGRMHWTTAQLMDVQPFELAGVRVDSTLRPLGREGEVLYENVHIMGGLLYGSDRIMEGSRQGIDLGSAYHAVEVALG
ncbi:MAG: anaerobic glycerol-3-phosphate dehydrogenase subunit B [Anaerolineales bacterium]|nr:anaerobic glycerol-3-phosphate dehydrogenase subunit B [Anaerolineales bacterium]